MALYKALGEQLLPSRVVEPLGCEVIAVDRASALKNDPGPALSWVGDLEVVLFAVRKAVALEVGVLVVDGDLVPGPVRVRGVAVGPQHDGPNGVERGNW